MQVHSEDFRLPKVNNFQKVPEFPVIRMPIDFTIPKKVGTFQGKLYAKKVGKSRSTVANVLRLLNLPQEIQDALVIGKITRGKW